VRNTTSRAPAKFQISTTPVAITCASM
jgi:hypothetical protein